MRRFRLQIATLACLVVALGLAGTVSAAQLSALTGHGILSRSEYQQLRAAQTRIRSLRSSDTHGLRQAQLVCARMRPVSRLIGTVRGGCLDLVRLAGDEGRLNARLTKCGINPGSEAGLLACLLPAVQSYYNDAEAFHRTEALVNQLARERGFSSACIAVVGDSTTNVAAEGRLADDLKAAVTALRRQDPSALQTLSANLKRDAEAIRPGSGSLALCPHA
jgi:hypothetical protein